MTERLIFKKVESEGKTYWTWRVELEVIEGTHPLTWDGRASHLFFARRRAEKRLNKLKEQASKERHFPSNEVSKIKIHEAHMEGKRPVIDLTDEQAMQLLDHHRCTCGRLECECGTDRKDRGGP